MILCKLSTLMARDKLRKSEVARLTGLNRSTVSSLFKGNCARIDLSAIDQLCQLFNCQVGDIFEHMPDSAKDQQ